MKNYKDKAYIFKKEKKIKINQRIAGEKIGLTQPSISNIMNSKIPCRKITAYCITKYLDENAEIEDYFDRVK